jgi:FkbM family methyltransferase
MDWNIPVECFCETNTTNISMRGLPVISAEILIKEYSDASIVVCVGSKEARLGIYDFLLKNGFNPPNIVSTFTANDQYFGYSFFPPIQGEIYVDIGVDDGGTIINYSNLSRNQYKKIIALEPDIQNIERINRNPQIKNIEGLQIIPKGAWSSTTKLPFECLGNGGSRISNIESTKAEFIKLDDLLLKEYSENIVIKMDIEGAELEALKGAEELIRKNKPRLAVCVYHKPEDIIDIPFYITSIAPEYRFFIRHNCLVNLTETVLYAVV